VAKTKELKRSWGQERIVFRQFWKPSPVRAALLSARNLEPGTVMLWDALGTVDACGWMAVLAVCLGLSGLL